MHLSPARLLSALARAALTGAVLLAGCVPSADLPETCDDPSVTIETRLANNHLEPADLEACQDQEVTIVVDVQQAGELHLHGYDEEAPEQEVEVGDEVRWEFTAIRPGEFPIELHGEPEVDVGTLTVHEH